MKNGLYYYTHAAGREMKAHRYKQSFSTLNLRGLTLLWYHGYQSMSLYIQSIMYEQELHCSAMNTQHQHKGNHCSAMTADFCHQCFNQVTSEDRHPIALAVSQVCGSYSMQVYRALCHCSCILYFYTSS